MTPREELYALVRSAAEKWDCMPRSVIDRTDAFFRETNTLEARKEVIAQLAKRNWATDRIARATGISTSQVCRIKVMTA